jgi:hypothetical protein
MDEIALSRGGEKVVFKKVGDRFAVRLKQGRAGSESSLEASFGRPPSEVKHVASVSSERMDVFSIADREKLEETMDVMRRARDSDVISHLYSIDESPEGAVIPTGTITLQFKADTKKARIESILAEHGLQIIDDLTYLPNAYSVKLTDASKENPLKIAKKLIDRDDVEIAEPEISFRVSFKYIPGDPLFRDQWHLKNRGDRPGLKAGADVSAEEAWERYGTGTRDVVVCVMDDGFDMGHPDLTGPGKIVAPMDLREGDLDPSPDLNDNHGTACAGVAIAEENGIGVVGLAPKCAFMPVRLSGWISDQAITDLFQYAMDKKADVISCSWSAAAYYFPLSTKMKMIISQAAVEGRRNGNGCVILFAAGNENRPLKGKTEDGRDSHQGFALHPDVIAVAASNSLDQRSSYSNYGPEIAICAPSSGQPGRGILTTDRRGSRGYTSDNYTYEFGGTSSATPLAAGLAALVLSANSKLTSAEVKRIIMETADKIDHENGQYVDGHSIYYGHGRINAERAVAAAAGDIEEAAVRSFRLEHRINRPIPDMGEAGDTIPFPLEVSIKEIDVSVEIRHAWSGDLRVALLPPRKNEIVLQHRTGGSRDDIVKSFRSRNERKAFEPVLLQPAKGDWTLKVYDLAHRDVGILVKWDIKITY